MKHSAFFGSHTFVPISWMCKKQTSVQFNRIRNQFFGYRFENVWYSRTWFLTSDRYCSLLNYDQSKQVQGNLSTIPTRTKILGKIDDLHNVDFLSSNANSSRQEVLLQIFEDNKSVIKMIIKGRSPTMRHVSRTHRVALDWLFDRINLDPNIEIIFFCTKIQLTDIILKGNCTRDKWKHNVGTSLMMRFELHFPDDGHFFSQILGRRVVIGPKTFCIGFLRSCFPENVVDCRMTYFLESMKIFTELNCDSLRAQMENETSQWGSQESYSCSSIIWSITSSFTLNNNSLLM